MKQSQALTDFYKAYLSWAESGAADNEPFKRDRGLCGNLCKFVLQVYGCDSSRFEKFEALETELLAQFESAGLCASYPFNEGCGMTYHHECVYGYPWQNKHRIEWVREHAKN